MADISDLAQQIAYYQAGGRPPGGRAIDKINKTFDTITGGVEDYNKIIKQRLEAKKLELEQTPYYKFDQSLPQDASAVDRLQKSSDTAQASYGSAAQLQRDTAGTAPDPGIQPTPYANPYAAFEKEKGFNPRLPLSAIKEIAQAKALSEPGVTLFTDKAGTRFGRYPSEETPYPYVGVPKKQATSTLAAQGRTETTQAAIDKRAHEIVPVMTEADALAEGGIPKNAKTFNPGDPNKDQHKLDTDILNYSKELRRDSVLNNMRTAGIGLAQVDTLLKSASEGNTVAATAIGAKMAKAMEGGGVLTNQDVTRYVQSGRLDRKAADTLSRWMLGTPTQATLGEIKQISVILKERYDEKIQGVYNDYVDRLSRNYHMAPEQAAFRLAVPYRPVSASMDAGGGGDVAISTATATGWNDNKEKRYQELLQKQAAGTIK